MRGILTTLSRKREAFLCDLHVHSTVSDGEMSPEWIQELAKRERRIMSITDHLRTSAYQSERVARSPWIIPGIEVKTVEGTDFNVHMNSVEELFDFEESVIGPANPGRTMLGATRLKYFELLGAAKERGHMTVGIHPTTCEGIATLTEAQQRDAARYLTCLELNGQVGAERNRAAKHLAKKLGLSVIAGGDCHFREHFLRTFTKFRFQMDEWPTAERIKREVERRKKFRYHLPDTTVRDRVRLFLHSAQVMLRRRGEGIGCYVGNLLKSYKLHEW